MTAHDKTTFVHSAPRSAGQADETALDALDDNATARNRLRRQAVKRELRLAAHDFAEGLRGLVRVSPLAALTAGVAFGVWFARGRRPRRR